MVRIYGVTTTSNTTSSGGTAVSIKIFGTTFQNGTVLLTLDGSGTETLTNIFSTATNKALSFTMNVVATTLPDSTQQQASWLVQGLLSKGATSATVRYTLHHVMSLSNDTMKNCEITFQENYSLGGLSILCKGVSQYNEINWVATITGSEV